MAPFSPSLVLRPDFIDTSAEFSLLCVFFSFFLYLECASFAKAADSRLCLYFNGSDSEK